MAWFGQSCFAVTLLHKVPHHGVSTCVRLEHKAWLRTSKLRSEAAQSLAGAATAPLAPVSSSAAEDEEKALITREYDRHVSTACVPAGGLLIHFDFVSIKPISRNPAWQVPTVPPKRLSSIIILAHMQSRWWRRAQQLLSAGGADVKMFSAPPELSCPGQTEDARQLLNSHRGQLSNRVSRYGGPDI